MPLKVTFLFIGNTSTLYFLCFKRVWILNEIVVATTSLAGAPTPQPTLQPARALGTWFIGPYYHSCTEVCESIGGTCNQAGPWPHTYEDMSAMVTSSCKDLTSCSVPGQLSSCAACNCTNGISSEVQDHPYFAAVEPEISDGFCIFFSFGAVNATCDAVDMFLGTSRFCPCMNYPTAAPTFSPTPRPSFQPALAPTYLPGAPTPFPSRRPTLSPSSNPTAAPTSPSSHPTAAPTFPRKSI